MRSVPTFKANVNDVPVRAIRMAERPAACVQRLIVGASSDHLLLAAGIYKERRSLNRVLLLLDYDA